LDALAAPGDVAGPHATDEGDEFALNGGPTDARAGFPAPEQTKNPVDAKQSQFAAVGGHLRQVVELEGQGPDPRDSNTHYRIDPTLTIIAMTLLVGRREIAAIARFATTLAQPQRRRLGLPFKKGPPSSLHSFRL